MTRNIAMKCAVQRPQAWVHFLINHTIKRWIKSHPPVWSAGVYRDSSHVEPLEIITTGGTCHLEWNSLIRAGSVTAHCSFCSDQLCWTLPDINPLPACTFWMWSREHWIASPAVLFFSRSNWGICCFWVTWGILSTSVGYWIISAWGET